MAMVHFKVSNNVKTGNILVSTISSDTCPDTCSFKEKGCYAKYGPLGMHWRKVTNGDRGNTFESYLQAIRDLPDGTLHRYAQAGDLIGNNLKIDSKALKAIVEANKGKKGFTYTHKPMTAANKKLVKYANNNGFTINLSSDTMDQADKNMALGIAPVVVVMPDGADKVSYTPAGHKVVVCPAASIKDEKGINCKRCKLCANADRDYIIGFPAHGTAKKTVSIIARG